MSGYIGKIIEEVHRQDDKWGEQNHDDLYWLGILMEEVGEVATELIEHRGKKLEQKTDDEIIQCAAVCLNWLNCRERRRRG